MATIFKCKHFGNNTRISVTSFLTAALLISLLISSSARAADTVKIKNIKGKVETRKDTTALWKTAKEGDALAENCQIKTGAGSEVLLMWAQGHAVKIFSTTIITVKELSTSGADEKSQLDINGGKLFAKAQKLKSGNSSFSVKTPTAVAGVRGTEFMTEVGENNASNISVLSGEIGVKSGEFELVMTDNMFISATENMEAPPQPQEIPPDIKTEMEAVSTEVNTEIKEEMGAKQQEEKSSKSEGEKKEETAKEESKDGEKEEGAAKEGETSKEDSSAATTEGGATETDITGADVNTDVEVDIGAAVEDSIGDIMSNTDSLQMIDTIEETAGTPDLPPDFPSIP